MALPSEVSEVTGEKQETIGCQQKDNYESQPDINIRSLFSEYPAANEIAKNWDMKAELVHVDIDYDISNGKQYENSITFKFEVAGNLENFLRVECLDVLEHLFWIH